MKYQSTLQKLIGIAAAGFCLSGMLSVLPVNAESAPPDAVGAVTASGKTTYYYDTIESGGASAMWNEAVAKHNATVTLYADWRAAEDGSFGKDGGGFVNGGVICVPTGCEITIDLNGFSVDRALDSAIDNGEVLCIQEGGSLYLSDTKSGNTGKLCGNIRQVKFCLHCNSSGFRGCFCKVRIYRQVIIIKININREIKATV